MTINANTKIASLVKSHPDALETIVSISQKFTKLRNPVLRKLMAGRTSIAMASKLGGCNIEDFFKKLQPLGFVIDRNVEIAREEVTKKTPGFLQTIQNSIIIELDVRPVIETGKDPLKIILEKVKALKKGEVLKIINSFEPTPLMSLLAKQGFKSYAETISNDLIHTYFYKATSQEWSGEANDVNYSAGWEEILNRFEGNIVTVDVRNLEMPLPMHSILESLEKLPIEKALFVYHKRIPVFLLPELEEQGFSYRIKEINDAEVHLLIYKD
jgi:uncharacterized protein (DUF2249 family)